MIIIITIYSTEKDGKMIMNYEYMRIWNGSMTSFKVPFRYTDRKRKRNYQVIIMDSNLVPQEQKPRGLQPYQIFGLQRECILRIILRLYVHTCSNKFKNNSFVVALH